MARVPDWNSRSKRSASSSIQYREARKVGYGGGMLHVRSIALWSMIFVVRGGGEGGGV